MYSSKFKIPEVVEVWQFEINNNTLDLANYDARIVDHIIGPVNTYASINTIGINLYNNQIKRILGRLYINPKSQLFDPEISVTDFKKWYLQHVSKKINQNISSLKVYKTRYLITGSSFSEKEVASKSLCKSFFSSCIEEKLFRGKALDIL